MRWVPYQTIMDCNNKKDTLCSMAGPHCQGHSNILPQKQQNNKKPRTKDQSGLRSTKIPTKIDNNIDNIKITATHLPQPPTKQKKAVLWTFNLSNKAQQQMYTNQTGKFAKKSSKANHYIMVLIEVDSNAILVEAMKNRSAGEMIQA